jgi:hypothetical protein
MTEAAVKTDGKWEKGESLNVWRRTGLKRSGRLGGNLWTERGRERERERER